MGCFVLNSTSERRFLQPVDRRRPPGPMKGKVIATGLTFFTCFSEFSNMNSDANASFLMKKQKFQFCFSELRLFDQSKCCFTVMPKPRMYSEGEGYIA